jgi:hypothetical protein
LAVVINWEEYECTNPRKPTNAEERRWKDSGGLREVKKRKRKANQWKREGKVLQHAITPQRNLGRAVQERGEESSEGLTLRISALIR